MQGKKNYQEKFFTNFRLSERVPDGNFYRRLKDALNLEYLRSLTAKYYGSEGQKSIDPVVFFKLMLVGYLENVNSDRKIIEQSMLRLDVLYFLGYDIDEPLPWHSTLSRTRKLYGEDVFLALFRDILRKCVEKGLVDGKAQAVDSAFIKANASISSMAERELREKSKKYFDDVTENEDSPSPQEKPAKDGGGSGKCNKRYASKTDPDARISKKPGKPSALNHLGIISVDTKSHVICGATVDYADKRDSRTAENIVCQTIENLSEHGIAVEDLLADAGFSSGEAYKYLEKQKINAYIPVHGRYQPEKDGFSYDKEADCYICSQGARLEFKGVHSLKGRGTSSQMYFSRARVCRKCPLKEQCCKSANRKAIYHSSDKSYYDAAHERTNTRQGKLYKRQRSATVEPVLGTLLEFHRMRKVYTLGQKLARKQFLMAAAVYNLKKLMKAMSFKKAIHAANAAKAFFLDKIRIWGTIISLDNKILAM
jgi:transposase